jgi:hypothetical protein
MGLKAMLSRLAQKISRPWQPPDIDERAQRELEQRQQRIAERAVEMQQLRERIDWETGRRDES